MPGIDYDSAINVHICRNGVPGCAGGYVPVMSAAYENQALDKQYGFYGFGNFGKGTHSRLTPARAHEHTKSKHQPEVDFCIVVPVSWQHVHVWITFFLIHEVVKKTTNSYVTQSHLINTFLKRLTRGKKWSCNCEQHSHLQA